jgi:hypothetical protein
VDEGALEGLETVEHDGQKMPRFRLVEVTNDPATETR